MTEALIMAAVALVGAAIAWKMLKGIVKTVVLVGIAILAGVYVFGGFA